MNDMDDSKAYLSGNLVQHTIGTQPKLVRPTKPAPQNFSIHLSRQKQVLSVGKDVSINHYVDNLKFNFGLKSRKF
jgi:hypothetical protein